MKQSILPVTVILSAAFLLTAQMCHKALIEVICNNKKLQYFVLFFLHRTVLNIYASISSHTQH